MRLRDKFGVSPDRVYVNHQLIPTYRRELYVEPLKGQYNLSIFSVYFQYTVQQEILEGVKFDEFGVLIAICQNKICHYDPLCACSMAYGIHRSGVTSHFFEVACTARYTWSVTPTGWQKER